MFDATTSSLTIGWDHAEGPVQQYKISYAPMTGDPITEYVSSSTEPPRIRSGTSQLMNCFGATGSGWHISQMITGNARKIPQ